MVTQGFAKVRRARRLTRTLYNHSSGNWMRYIPIILAALSLTSYMSLTQRPRQLLEVSDMDAPIVYQEARRFLTERGYTVLEDDPAFGYLRVESQEYDGERHGLLVWREKLFIEVEIRRDLRRPDLTLVFGRTDRKSTRLNSSHLGISYAVFCLK